MDKIKSFFYPMNKDKAFKLGAVAVGAIGIIFALAFFFINCFDLSKSKFYNFYFVVILLCMIGTTVYLLRFLLLDKEWSYSRVFVILALGWSICMQFVMPPISGVDEATHYYSAYHCSNIILGMKDHELSTNTEYDGNWMDGESYFYMRAEDFYNLQYVDVTFPYQYQVLADGVWFRCSDEGKQLVPCYEYPARARRYLLSGAGIALARLLGFGFVGTVFMGRFMNSLMLIFFGWFCLKLLPFGKLQVVSFALFPTILELCASYSYDNMSILFSLLMLTMCLYYSQDKVKLHSWDIIIIAICIAMLIPNKTVYALFGVWFLLIPIKKWWSDVALSKKWYEYGILAVVLAGIVVVGRKLITKYYWAVYSQIFWKRGEVSIEQDDSMQSYTWWYFKDHIPETLKFAWEGIKVDFWYNIKHVIGAEIGHVRLNAQVPLACTVALLIVLIVGIVINKGKRMKGWQYVIFAIGAILCLAAIFIGCLIRFTPVEGSERVQISYRYLIPIYLCLSVALGTDAKENKKAMALIYIQNIILIFSMCGVLYFLFHLRDGMGVPEILQGIIQ